MTDEGVGVPIKEYLRAAIQQIKEAMPQEGQLSGTVDFELSTILRQEAGKSKIYVLAGDAAAQPIHKITLRLHFTNDLDKAKEEAELAEAVKRKRAAEIESQKFDQLREQMANRTF